MAWTPTEELDEYAAAFAAAWGERTGASAKVFRRSRLFSLGELELPAPCPRGTARVAFAADRDLLESWFAAFVDEVGDLAGRIPGAAAGARLCGSGHRSGEPGGAGGWGEACGPVHGPGQPDEQRLVPAPGVPAGRGSRRADLRNLSGAFVNSSGVIRRPPGVVAGSGRVWAPGFRSRRPE